MTTHFVSRHPSAQEWARAEGLPVDRVAEHLDLALVQPGDRVLGSLPVNLAAAVCARGGRYLHLSLELPRDWRGRELSAADLKALGARIEEYQITRLP